MKIYTTAFGLCGIPAMSTTNCNKFENTFLFKTPFVLSSYLLQKILLFLTKTTTTSTTIYKRKCCIKDSGLNRLKEKEREKKERIKKVTQDINDLCDQRIRSCCVHQLIYVNVVAIRVANFAVKLLTLLLLSK